MTQDKMKQKVATYALKYVIKDTIVGVGTGSTANFFIDALAAIKKDIIGTVASSVITQNKLKKHGIKVFDLNEVDSLSIYVDGADEIDQKLHMIKGGGGALTREKIVASTADKFICIADESKLVKLLGNFPLPIEVIPMAVNAVKMQIEKITTGRAILRDFYTDNGNKILDIHGLKITNAIDLENKLNAIVGIVNNGLFANRCADVLLLSTTDGVKTFT